MTIVAIKVTVHRLRHRYRELLREEISHTVASAEEVNDEIRHLIAVMSE
jgi:RNA polymerase sigma-70 factor (ECF subfamily)